MSQQLLELIAYWIDDADQRTEARRLVVDLQAEVQRLRGDLGNERGHVEDMRRMYQDSKAQHDRLVARITAIIRRENAGPLPTGEPDESVTLGRLQLSDELAHVLREEPGP